MLPRNTGAEKGASRERDGSESFLLAQTGTALIASTLEQMRL